MGTMDVGCHLELISISVLVGDEVSARSIVVDQAIRLRTGVGKCLRSLAGGLQDNLTEPHFNVMLVAKSGELPFHRETGHTTSLKTAERQLLRECLKLDQQSLRRRSVLD